MNIPILFENNFILVIDKPSGVLVHPIPGGQGKTLIDWLRDRYPGFEWQNWPDATRPGIVHRLDRDTSGVMIVAKSPQVLSELQAQFAGRDVQKTYLALVVGSPEWETRTITAPVSRGEGTKRKARYLKLPGETAKDAETLFTVLKRFILPDGQVSLIQAEPKTGRTHQIRVHLDLAGHPILGDPWYETKESKRVGAALSIQRLMLHAQQLTFLKPQNEWGTGEWMSPLPHDFTSILDNL